MRQFCFWLSQRDLLKRTRRWDDFFKIESVFACLNATAHLKFNALFIITRAPTRQGDMCV